MNIRRKTIIIDRNSSSTAINILSPQSFLITIGKSQTQFVSSKQYIFQNKHFRYSSLAIFAVNNKCKCYIFSGYTGL